MPCSWPASFWTILSRICHPPRWCLSLKASTFAMEDIHPWAVDNIITEKYCRYVIIRFWAINGCTAGSPRHRIIQRVQTWSRSGIGVRSSVVCGAIDSGCHWNHFKSGRRVGSQRPPRTQDCCLLLHTIHRFKILTGVFVLLGLLHRLTSFIRKPWISLSLWLQLSSNWPPQRLVRETTFWT